MDDGPPEKTTCPECSAEDYFDAGEVEEQHPEFSEGDLAEFDRVCANCGEAFSA